MIVFAKPIRIGALKELIRARLAAPHAIKRLKPESVASILERETEPTIQNWPDSVERDAELRCIPRTRTERTGHLPRLLQDLIIRLRLDSGSKAPISMAARDYGQMRGPTGVYRYHAGGRISYLAGKHLQHFAKEFGRRGLR
jgi:hypothetical protein